MRAKWQKNCQQQDASSERELRPKSFTWNNDSVNAHLSLPFHTLLLTVLRLFKMPVVVSFRWSRLGDSRRTSNRSPD
jgi:hypothetical protein